MLFDNLVELKEGENLTNDIIDTYFALKRFSNKAMYLSCSFYTNLIRGNDISEKSAIDYFTNECMVYYNKFTNTLTQS